jgi:hypothetical protein
MKNLFSQTIVIINSVLAFFLLCNICYAQEVNELTINDYNYNVVRVNEERKIVWTKPLLANQIDSLDNKFIIYGFANVKNGKITSRYLDYDYWLVRVDSSFVINIFPNPTNNVINVTLSNFSNGLFFYLYDLKGKAILKERIYGYNCLYQLPPISNGVYIYKIISQKKQIKSGQLCVFQE